LGNEKANKSNNMVEVAFIDWLSVIDQNVKQVWTWHLIGLNVNSKCHWPQMLRFSMWNDKLKRSIWWRDIDWLKYQFNKF
jgi:hypothetical protein